MRWHKKSIQETPLSVDPYDLDKVLLQFGKDAWTIRDSCAGTHIFGETGSGKTSGPLATIVKQMMKAGYGALCLCAKPEMRHDFETWAKATGREKHLVIMSPKGDPYHDNTHWRFNFLDYELQRAAANGGGITENLVHLFLNIAELVEGKANVADGDNFWMRAMRQLVFNACDLLRMARGTLTLQDIVRLVLEAPKTEDQPYDERWQKHSFCARCLREADSNVAASGNARDLHDFDTVWDYWLKDYASLADRTKTSIVATFTSIADMLAHGHTWEMFGTTTNIIPEVTFDGALLCIDLPIQTYHSVGRVAQGIMKFMFQRSVLARSGENAVRPVVLIIDESAGFITSADFAYQAVARSARAASIFATQNISMYYATLGANGRDSANAILGNFATRIFCSNSDINTNQYAADTIGQHWTTTHNFGASHNNQGSSTSGGSSDSVQYKMLPSAFTTLRKGGPANRRIVEAIVFQSGRIFQDSGDTYQKVQFKQGKE